MFNKDILYSPVTQPFIWGAEYVDGSFLSEFDLYHKSENEFSDIQRNNLLRFGIIGSGTKSYFEVYGGIFKVLGQMYHLSYIHEGVQYAFIGQPKMYNDIITYKDAEFLFDPRVPNSGSSHITQFNFGYKQQLSIYGVNFSFKAICQFPQNEIPRFTFKIVSDKDMNGQLIIYKNNHIIDTIEAHLQANVGGEIIWQMK